MSDYDREAHKANYAARFTTEGLEATIAAGGEGTPGGLHPRQATELLALDDPALRQRAYDEAQTRQNLSSSGILSGHIYAAVAEIKRRLANGTLDQMLWAERIAHNALEAERAARASGLSHDAAVHAAFTTAFPGGRPRS